MNIIRKYTKTTNNYFQLHCIWMYFSFYKCSWSFFILLACFSVLYKNAVDVVDVVGKFGYSQTEFCFLPNKV